ncbi:MAG: hypothetical protein V4736_15065 [Bdellovibrionota bacterium]
MESSLNNLAWIEEHLPHDIQMLPKHGGQAYFLDDHMVLILVEKPGRNCEHKGVTYDFDLWKGCIFPVEYKKQGAFFLKYLFLENHPASKDWLYIPMESENFEEEVKQMLREISKRNVLLGLRVKYKSPSKRTAAEAKNGSPKAKKMKTGKKKEKSFLLNLIGKGKTSKE